MELQPELLVETTKKSRVTSETLEDSLRPHAFETAPNERKGPIYLNVIQQLRLGWFLPGGQFLWSCGPTSEE